MGGFPAPSRGGGATDGLAALGASTFAALTSNADIFMAILDSRTVAEGVIKKLDLQRRWGIPNIEDALQALASLRLFTLTKQGTIIITVENTDPKLAADIANEYAEELDRLNRDFGITDAGRNRNFLEKRLAETEQALRESEETLRRFQERNKLVAGDRQASSIVSSNARLQDSLRQDEARLEGLRAFATDQNPEVIQSRRKIQELKRQLSQLQFGRGIDLPSESENPGQRRQDLHLPAAQMPEVAMILLRLQREAKIQETLFAMLTGQLELAKIAEAKDIPTLQILDRAVPSSKKVRPKIKQAVMFAGLLSVVAGLFLALAIERIRSGRLSIFAVSEATRG